MALCEVQGRLYFRGCCYAVTHPAPSHMSVQHPMQVEDVRSDTPGVASAVPQLIRRQSRGSQALQLARSLGSAGATFTLSLPNPECGF